jgi:hypothetical protein
MAKRLIKQEAHSWTVYRLKSTPAKLVGIIDGAPDADSAIQQAIELYAVPVNERWRLMARRRP